MSASSKKKLRNAEVAEKMTERQMAEKKEAKKLKIYTVVFCVVMAAMLIFTIAFTGYNAVTNSGMMERKTIAATVNGHDITTAELNYYYIDYINNFCSNYSSYLAYIMDTTAPLDQQQYSETQTWADYFLSEAVLSAASNYTLADAAKAAGHTLTAEEETSIESSLQTATFYAIYSYGFSDLTSYLKGMYGNGASEESYREYLTMSALASSYYNAKYNSLTYTDDQIRAADAEDPLAYNSYNYNYYYIPVSDYLTGGTTAEDGTVTYSDAENEAARAAAEEAAASLTAETILDVEAFDAAIDVIAAGDTSYSCNNYMYSSLLSAAQEWISDASRVEGDKNYFAYTTHTHADGSTHAEEEDSAAYDQIKGYYVVFFKNATDNTMNLVNVRHVLITEGGTYNSNTGVYDYTDDMAAAQAKAESLLADWEAGKASSETFAELAKANSTDGNASTGGLYEDIYPGQMTTAFNDWCFDASRQAGDYGIVKTEYGVHIMYFEGYSDITYRDFMITNDLTDGDITTWYAELTADMTTELKNTKFVKTDLVLSSAN